MHTSRVMALVIILLVSVSASADLITNYNSVGRDSGAYHVFHGFFKDEKPFLVQGTCWAEAGQVPYLSRLTCTQQTQPISLSEVLKEFSPNLDWEYFLFGARNNGAKLTSALQAVGISEVVSDFQHVFFREVLKSVKTEERQNEKLNSDFLRGNETLLRLIGMIFDEEKVEFFAGASASSESEQTAKVRNFTPAFISRFNRTRRLTEGHRCHREEVGLQTADGGCRVDRTGIVYGPPEYVVDRFHEDVWLNQDVAVLRCRSLRRGGYGDWRLPTRKELTEGSLVSDSLGFNRFLYYWTGDTSIQNVADKKTYQLGNRTISFESTPTLVGYRQSFGYNVFDPRLHESSSPVFDHTSTHIYEANRQLFAVFDIQVTSIYLVRPSLERNFEIRRHALLGATGEIASETRRETNSPGLVETKSYDRYWGQSWGSYPVVRSRSIEDVVIGNNRYTVNPFEYVSYSLPPDIAKDQIALLCVRQGTPQREGSH